MTKIDKLSESLEDYLEVILHLVNENQVARVRDIASRMKVKMSSVSGALSAMADRKLINYTPYEVITLTAKGRRIAKDVIRRHEILRDFFMKVLMVNEKHADETACKMEHALTREILERFVKFVDFFETCPIDAEWTKKHSYRCDYKKTMKNSKRSK